MFFSLFVVSLLFRSTYQIIFYNDRLNKSGCIRSQILKVPIYFQGVHNLT